MTDWESLCHQLARVARLAGCRCEYERQADVPVWHKTESGLERRLIKKCSRCIAVESYDAATQPEVAI